MTEGDINEHVGGIEVSLGTQGGKGPEASSLGLDPTSITSEASPNGSGGNVYHSRPNDLASGPKQLGSEANDEDVGPNEFDARGKSEDVGVLSEDVQGKELDVGACVVGLNGSGWGVDVGCSGFGGALGVKADAVSFGVSDEGDKAGVADVCSGQDDLSAGFAGSSDAFVDAVIDVEVDEGAIHRGLSLWIEDESPAEGSAIIREPHGHLHSTRVFVLEFASEHRLVKLGGSAHLRHGDLKPVQCVLHLSLLLFVGSEGLSPSGKDKIACTIDSLMSVIVQRFQFCLSFTWDLQR
jgi:hypothetical protein